MKKIIIILSISFCTINVFAQNIVAENMLLFQRIIGGWPKHYQDKKIDYNKVYSVAEKASIKDDYNRNDATIDNEATTKEIRYLLKAYKETSKKDFLLAAENGIKYLLLAQYKNGGWPQFYPDLSSYRHLITYNDNAMVNVLNVLYDLSKQINNFEVVDSKLISKANESVERGIQCILRTQIKVKGKLTGWCQQHDEITLQPAVARKFELISISGNETVGITQFLMRIDNPNKKIECAITKAVEWLNVVKIQGFKYIDIDDATQPNGKDRVVIKDSASTIWARFYDIDTNKPFFCGRDGIKKNSVAEIEHERRVGYAWYSTSAKRLLEKDYPKWLDKKRN